MNSCGPCSSSRISLAFDGIHNRYLAAGRNANLELHSARAERFIGRRALSNFPLIVMSALDSFTNVCFRRLRSTVAQDDFDFGHQLVLISVVALIEVGDVASFQNAPSAKDSR